VRNWDAPGRRRLRGIVAVGHGWADVCVREQRRAGGRGVGAAAAVAIVGGAGG